MKRKAHVAAETEPPEEEGRADEPCVSHPCHKGYAEMTPELREWYDKQNSERAKAAHEVTEDDAYRPPTWSAGLRLQWAQLPAGG